MKNTITTIFLFSALLVVVSAANAQMMGSFDSSQLNWNEVVEHTAKGEQEGKALFDKLQSKQAQCANLSEEDFDALGEYFMGQMISNSHAAMNAMMMQMHGEQGEEQIHIAMGKRLSGCDTLATTPFQTFGWMPMMQMMGGNMMNFGYGFGFFGWFFMLVWLVLIIVAVVALVKWLANQFKGASSKNAFDILKGRYARGEINKQEFEDKKKDLSSSVV